MCQNCNTGNNLSWICYHEDMKIIKTNWTCATCELYLEAARVCTCTYSATVSWLQGWFLNTSSTSSSSFSAHCTQHCTTSQCVAQTALCTNISAHPAKAEAATMWERAQIVQQMPCNCSECDMPPLHHSLDDTVSYAFWDPNSSLSHSKLQAAAIMSSNWPQPLHSVTQQTSCTCTQQLVSVFSQLDVQRVICPPHHGGCGCHFSHVIQQFCCKRHFSRQDPWNVWHQNTETQQVWSSNSL
jgi:hypothetical protein